MCFSLRKLAVAHGAFYFLSGVWPLFDIDSFQAVTGPKFDLWLVRTLGLLLAADGVVLLVVAARRMIPGAIVALALLHAGALAAVDVTYVSLDRIAPIYPADAAVQTVLILGWLWAWTHRPLAALPMNISD